MSSVDPVAILGALDHPVDPRPEFAETLLSRLLEELDGAQVPTRAPGWKRLRLPRILPAAPPRLRLLLIVLALLLLLATVALATYFGVRTWISAGPRGVQYTSDFRLSVVFHEPAGPESRTRSLSSFVIAPSGRDIYAVRYFLNRPVPPWHHVREELLRIAGVASDRRAHEERLLTYRDLAEPRLWDPGTDLKHRVISDYGGQGSVAVAANGDVFLLAAARPGSSINVRTPREVSLIVRHSDGSLQKVLTFQELVHAGVVKASAANHGALGIAASAPDRLWVKVRQPSGFLLEVIDPNGDGHWADRVIRRLRLPPSVPNAGMSRGRHWSFHQLLSESSVPGEDRSRSILVTASNSLAFRVYRIADFDGDGDALDKGEAQVLFRAHRFLFGPTEVTVAPRTILGDGKVVLHELVASGFSRPTRISRISRSGKVTDIGRSFLQLEKVLAGRDGSIYAVVQSPGSRGPGWIIYRLTPRA